MTVQQLKETPTLMQQIHDAAEELYDEASVFADGRDITPAEAFAAFVQLYVTARR